MRRIWQRAVVTGASSGIGEAIARRLAAAGTELVLVARDEPRLEALAGELREAHAVRTEVLPADLGDRVQRQRVEDVVADPARPVDLLVNNAGYGFNGAFGDIAVDDEDTEIQVNVVALMRLTHAAVTRMRAAAAEGARGRRRDPSAGIAGGILLISSVISFEPVPLNANYGATKAYVTYFGQTLHEEVRRDGIVVTTVCPGLTRTRFQERGGHDLSDVGDWAWQTPEQVARAALTGLDRKRALVVPGALNKGLQVGARLLPASVTRRSAGEVVRRRSGPR